jgi:dGTP triphosphohydrolase
MSTLESLGHLGEFVGAIGVVVSLVYLARQMRQNTISVRAASFNSMIQNSIRLLEHSFRDREFAAFLARAEEDPEGLTAEERVRWDSYMTAVYRHFGNLVYQSRVGALDEQMWQAYRRDLRRHLETEAWANWYLGHREVFSRSLTDHVGQLLEEIEAEKAEEHRESR